MPAGRSSTYSFRSARAEGRSGILSDYDRNVRPLRDALEEAILSSIPNTELNGHKMRL